MTAHIYQDIVYHIVFSAKYREPVISPLMMKRFRAYDSSKKNIKNVLKKCNRSLFFIHGIYICRVICMEAIKYKTIVKNDGVINLTGVPFKKGQEVEMIIIIETTAVKRDVSGKKFNAVKINTSGLKLDREAANER